MPSFLFAVFLLSTTAAGCSSSAIGGSVSPELPEVSSHSCPPTSEEDNFLQTLFSIPQLPFINVSAQVKQNGFCPIPIEVEELKRRLRFDPETKLNASGLISSQGYPVENYEVPTIDGFLLGVQRIPHGKNNSHIKGPRPTVLLQHGLFACSTNWVSNMANESLGFILADAGYDVWLGNARGNTYSLKHLHLKKWQREFWMWSWDEMAKYDLPNMVDFILNATGHKQISYVGHSQGTTMGFAALSTNKDLESKINLFVALAPVANVSHMTSAMKLLTPPEVYIPLVDVLDDLHIYDFLAHNELFDIFANTVCDTKETVIFCEAVMFLFGGYSCQHMNASRVPVYVSNTPAGTSIWNLAHWSQIINSATFSMYDYGCKGNVDHYNQTTPPQYNVQDISIPVATFTGTKDVLSDPADVAQLLPQIRNLVFKKNIDTYGHLDFIWAFDAVTYIYQDVVKLLNTVSNGSLVDYSGHEVVKPVIQ